MSPHPPPTLEDSLREMFPEEWLRQTAKETGLIVRERKIDPVIIFWVLTLGFGVRLQRTLASLKREYEKESHKTLSDSSWYYRFTPELVEFLHQCVIHPRFPPTHNDVGGFTPRSWYSCFCFSSISPTLSDLPGCSKHSMTSSLSNKPGSV